LLGVRAATLEEETQAAAMRRGKPRVQRWWLVKCDCGKERVLNTNEIKWARRTSCGCDGVRHRNEFGQLKGLPEREAALGTMFANLSPRARKRGLEVTISKQFFMEMSSRTCIYCGTPPLQIARLRKKSWPYNGIDRLDSDRGYTPDNCVPCCGRCNKGKNDMSFDEFKKWIALLHERFQKGEINTCAN